MSQAMTVTDDAARLAAVRRYDILDTPPDGAFDRITQLAARICRTPVSTISVVDEDRIWFKSAHGVDVVETGRDPGLCASAVMQAEPWIVADARVDPRALDNPLVRGELGVQFYAGIPLTTSDGHNLGTLNVIDVVPRELDAGQLACLEDLAAVVLDELELRLAARATVALEAAREAARVRDAVMAGVTHEMRTPIAVLKGIAALEDDPGGMTAAERTQTRALLHRQLNHLDWLVQQFLDYVSLEGDESPAVERVPTDLRRVIQQARDIFAGEKPIDLRVDDDLPLALADPPRTRQIVSELINNAVRFGAGRPIEVHARRHDEATVAVAVTDGGAGIHPADHQRVFAKGHRSRDSVGTGLGLYLGRAFAEAQQGRIELRSEPGTGSTFTLVLPAAATAQ